VARPISDRSIRCIVNIDVAFDDTLVKITTILPNGGDVVAAREARSKALGDRKPASTLIVGGLANPAWKIEIEGVAVA
jgi:2-iminobutanoate/2-iminopropanoate deaminase